MIQNVWFEKKKCCKINIVCGVSKTTYSKMSTNVYIHVSGNVFIILKSTNLCTQENVFLKNTTEWYASKNKRAFEYINFYS